MALSLYVNLSTLAAASPSVSLIQSGCLHPAHSPIVWVSLLLFSVFTYICLRMFRLKNPSDGGVFTVFIDSSEAVLEIRSSCTGRLELGAFLVPPPRQDAPDSSAAYLDAAETDPGSVM